MAKQTLVALGPLQRNNFDLIRLIAASQVAIVHGIEHLKVEPLYALAVYLHFFPGVPVFFFLSGLLISASWERDPNLRHFLANRFYRIIPALWCCVLLACVSILACAHILDVEIPYYALSLWAVLQGTFLPQWNPQFLDWFGVGVVNGSLWTIPVELSFYVLLPFVYTFSRRMGFGLNKVLAILLFTSLTVFYLLIFADPSSDMMVNFNKLVGFSPIPWFWMFCFGVLVQRYINCFHRFTVNKAYLFLLIFVVTCFLGTHVNSTIFFGIANDVGIFHYASLCFLVLSLGFSLPSLSDSLLNRNDISYGVYIYHMIVFNCLILFTGGGIYSLIGGLLLTCVLALLSWKYIERPFLRKRKSFLYGR